MGLVNAIDFTGERGGTVYGLGGAHPLLLLGFAGCVRSRFLAFPSIPSGRSGEPKMAPLPSRVLARGMTLCVERRDDLMDGICGDVRDPALRGRSPPTTSGVTREAAMPWRFFVVTILVPFVMGRASSSPGALAGAQLVDPVGLVYLDGHRLYDGRPRPARRARYVDLVVLGAGRMRGCAEPVMD